MLQRGPVGERQTLGWGSVTSSVAVMFSGVIYMSLVFEHACQRTRIGKDILSSQVGLSKFFHHPPADKPLADA